MNLMPPVSNAAAEECLRRLLAAAGFSLNPARSHGQTGVDVLATRGDERYHIEVIGYKNSGPARAKDFYESFFRAVSRIKDGAVHCVIAMPKQSKVGLPARARQYGAAWQRIGNTFPELEIWLIDTVGESYQRSSWSEWLGNYP
jgi:hypothetical protein